MDIIKKVYLKIQKEQLARILKTKVPVQNIRASELSKCKLKTFFRLMGYIPSVNEIGLTAARMTDYGYDGDVLHDSTRRWMVKHGIKVDGIEFRSDGSQKELINRVMPVRHNEEQFNISMRLDGIVKIDRFKHVLEIKTLGWGKIRALRELWQRTANADAVAAWVTENRKDFLFQATACMRGTDINRAYVLFKDRSDSAHGLHSYNDPTAILGGATFHFEKAIWTQILGRGATIAKGLRTGTPPRPEFNAGSTDCKQCNFFHLCHGATRREQANVTPYQLHPQLGLKLHAEDLK